ncbi:hypothetical protein [Henriciella aquimarina]|uniref:hypothetical protein n=1 Tax=Henriciella aquimarina TaxID=545261 RepID=UPI000A050135|nr:hypothetical protein [Henriciella aquimarina]
MFKKMLALSLAASAIGFGAMAQDKDETVFAYNPTDSAQEIHAGFLADAKAACEKVTSYPSAIKGVYPLAEWSCVNRLMNEAVTAVDRPELTQLHKNFVDPAQPYRVAGTN